MSKRSGHLKAKGAHADGQGKKGSNRDHVRTAGHSSTHERTGQARQDAKGKTQTRSNNTIRRLKMYAAKPDIAKMKQRPEQQSVMIEPGRKWFNNTRVVSQEKLDQFREALEARSKDPSSILLKRTKLPVSLFDDSAQSGRKRAANLLTVESFEDTFSSNKRRKRPNLPFLSDLADFARKAEEKNEQYVADKIESDRALMDKKEEEQQAVKGQIEAVMLKGTSSRIWGELYKVIDSSDVIIEVLDARDPLGTRCYSLEQHIKKDRPFKHIVLLLNKCDLIPSHVTEKWVKILGKEFPTVAFKASMKHPFGKKATISLIRQFAEHMKNRKHVSVGIIGYPNVGKSSVINTLKAKKVCNTAPIPGETKVWQYVALTNRVHLVDCPGIVMGAGKEDGVNNVNKVLKGVVRAEKLDDPQDYVWAVIERVGREKMNKHYKIPEDNQNWQEPEEFLELLARQSGRLRKGGDPDIGIVARSVIYDFQRGKLPYFIPPPKSQKKNTVDELEVAKSGDVTLKNASEPEQKGCGRLGGSETPEKRGNEDQGDVQGGRQSKVDDTHPTPIQSIA